MTSETKRTAYVEIRSQHSKKSSPNGFGGPDTYISVQVVPDGVERLKVLNKRAAKERGIELIYCGEGYSNRVATNQSMLNQARAEAERIATEINAEKSQAVRDSVRDYVC